ncbi:uncharacterized protein LOC131531088 [Onychostoma macrolepis]|uniref:uncharacterized protein LOC131531088 n=1 Tax=Onychostoma macrolepis TaxID=369639 RepID=UPI00272CCA2F|nr:uncharacterized protein LOC131531088 [Onychostoma macrolepis]
MTNSVYSSGLFGFRAILPVFVKDGDSVTLHTDVKTERQKYIKWYFNGIQVAEITGDLSFICTDVQCKDGEERFRDRVKLDNETGSLTIINITNTDFGLYKVQIINSSTISEKTFFVAVYGAPAVKPDEMSVEEGESVTLDPGVIKNQNDLLTWYFNDILIAEINEDQCKICTDEQCKERFRDRRFSSVGTDEVSVSVTEGDSVTLHTDVETNQQDIIGWYFNGIYIAEISEDPSKICTDDQCDERFRNRLKLDHQSGSLTITNTTTRDSGVYKLQIINSRISQKIFIVAVYDAPEKYEMNRKSVKEGDSVTLDPAEIKNPNDLMKWYFNAIRIAEITGEQSEICTDVQCKERFRDRLKLDHQSGSLTIMNTRTRDSGVYKLEITSSNSNISISVIKSFSATVTRFPRVIGAIDCTHVAISTALGEHEADYVNRKSFHSLNVQRFEEGLFDGLLTRPQNRFNVALSKTRVKIEMTFGILKARFNCLWRLRVSPERASQIVAACAILHNIATIRKEQAPPLNQLLPDEIDPITLDHPAGAAVRDAVTIQYFT